jgi:two-component system LytT family response regulator
MESEHASEAIRVVIGIRDDTQGSALAAQLSAFDDVIVVARAKAAQQTLDSVQRASPDLLFLERAMLSAGEVRTVRRVLERGSPLIAFVMTEPQPLAAFEPNAIDYLVLPATRRRTRITIERAKERLEATATMATIVTVEGAETSPVDSDTLPKRFLRRIPARTRDGVRIIPVEELVSAVANRWYLHLTTSNGERYTILHVLKDLEAKLDPASFIRLSRNTLVNIGFVSRVVPNKNGVLTVELRSGETHEASRRQSRALREWLLHL